MDKVSAAANRIIPLPPVPERRYSSIPTRLHEIKLVTSPSSENQGVGFKGTTSHKMVIEWFLNQEIYFWIILQWLGANSTLEKEFARDKLANIRLRAVPKDFWVVDCDRWKWKLCPHLNSHGKYFKSRFLESYWEKNYKNWHKKYVFAETSKSGRISSDSPGARR